MREICFIINYKLDLLSIVINRMWNWICPLNSPLHNSVQLSNLFNSTSKMNIIPIFRLRGKVVSRFLSERLLFKRVPFVQVAILFMQSLVLFVFPCSCLFSQRTLQPGICAPWVQSWASRYNWTAVACFLTPALLVFLGKPTNGSLVSQLHNQDWP